VVARWREGSKPRERTAEALCNEQNPPGPTSPSVSGFTLLETILALGVTFPDRDLGIRDCHFLPGTWGRREVEPHRPGRIRTQWKMFSATSSAPCLRPQFLNANSTGSPVGHVAEVRVQTPQPWPARFWSRAQRSPRNPDHRRTRRIPSAQRGRVRGPDRQSAPWPCERIRDRRPDFPPAAGDSFKRLRTNGRTNGPPTWDGPGSSNSPSRKPRRRRNGGCFPSRSLHPKADPQTPQESGWESAARRRSECPQTPRSIKSGGSTQSVGITKNPPIMKNLPALPRETSPELRGQRAPRGDVVHCGHGHCNRSRHDDGGARDEQRSSAGSPGIAPGNFRSPGWPSRTGPSVEPGDPILNQDFGNGERIQVRVASEEARLNLNLWLADQRQSTLVLTPRRLGHGAGKDAERLVYAMADWVDGDVLKRAQGAEVRELRMLKNRPYNRPCHFAGRSPPGPGFCPPGAVRPDLAIPALGSRSGQSRSARRAR